MFGVHQFLLHPLFVTLGWRRCYDRWPTWWELLVIVVHDWGYWGCDDMDGPCGKLHPELGARLSGNWVFRLEFARRRLRPRALYWRLRQWWGGNVVAPEICRQAAYNAAIRLAFQAWCLAALHSASYAEKFGWPRSNLFLPDKVSVLYEPSWFYLLRSWLTGEIDEYVANNPHPTRRAWLRWFKQNVRSKVEEFRSLRGK